MSIKFCSNKSNAKRALKAIGDKAFEAAETLLIEQDGKWGFNVEAAQAAQNPAPKATSQLSQLLGTVPVALPSGKVTRVTEGKKTVVKAQPANTVQAEKAELQKRFKGYKIQQDRETRNGVTRPSAGTLTAQAWAIFDKMGEVSAQDLRNIHAETGLNKTMLSCQRCAWKAFNK